MLYADYLLKLSIFGLVNAAFSGMTSNFEDAKAVITPVQSIYKVFEGELKPFMGNDAAYPQNSEDPSVESNVVLNVSGQIMSLEHLDNIIPESESKMVLSQSSDNFSELFPQGSQIKLTHSGTSNDRFTVGGGTKAYLQQNSTLSESHGESGESFNEVTQSKGLHPSPGLSELTSTVTSVSTSSPTISPLEDFFQSWEAILIISVAALCICCQLILCLITRTRLRHAKCFQRLLVPCKPEEEDEEPTYSEGDSSEGRTRKSIGMTWSSEELKNIDYFDYLSETKTDDDSASADSSRRPSDDTLESDSSGLHHKSPTENLRGLKGLFRRQSEDSQESISRDHERRQSGDSLDGPVSILRRSSGDSLDERPVDTMRSPGESSARRALAKRKRMISLTTLRRSSGDSLDDGPVNSLRLPVDSSARRPSSDSLNGGPRGILRRSSGDGFYRRPSSDNLVDGPISILRRESGDSLDGVPARSSRRRSGDSVRWKSSDDVFLSDEDEGDLTVHQDSSGPYNDSTEDSLANQTALHLKSTVTFKRCLSMEYKVASRPLESIVEIHDEFSRSPSGSCAENHPSHPVGLRSDG